MNRPLFALRRLVYRAGLRPRPGSWLYSPALALRSDVARAAASLARSHADFVRTMRAATADALEASLMLLPPTEEYTPRIALADVRLRARR